MKFFVIALFVTTSFAHAALNMKPGLWNINMVIKSEGKEFNPAAQMQAAMAKMPEAQKKKMMEMMGKQGAGMSSDGKTQVCYSKAMIEKPDSFGKQANTKCDTKIVTNSSSKVVTNFKCEDGTVGDATWTVAGAEKMTGLVNVKDPKGKASTINYTGSFAKADCGSVKPVM